MDINQWVGCGRLCGDAENIATKSGTSMCKFRLAVNNPRDKERTLFVNILCFGKTAEILQPMLVKGKMVSVIGSLSIESYDKDGEKRYNTNILANQISLGPDVTPRKQPVSEVINEENDVGVPSIVDEDIPF